MFLLPCFLCYDIQLLWVTFLTSNGIEASSQAILDEMGQGCEDFNCTSEICAADEYFTQPFSSCKVDTCNNGQLDDNEANTDCGAACPEKCGAGQFCWSGYDCETGSCGRTQSNQQFCVSATCEDGIRNGDESDTDCGQACPGKPCAQGRRCNQIDRGDRDCAGNLQCRIFSPRDDGFPVPLAGSAGYCNRPSGDRAPTIAFPGIGPVPLNREIRAVIRLSGVNMGLFDNDVFEKAFSLVVGTEPETVYIDGIQEVSPVSIPAGDPDRNKRRELLVQSQRKLALSVEERITIASSLDGVDIYFRVFEEAYAMELVLERMENIFIMRYNCLGDKRPCAAHENSTFMSHTQWCFGGGGFGDVEPPSLSDPTARTLEVMTIDDARNKDGLHIDQFCGLSLIGAFSHFGMNITSARYVTQPRVIGELSEEDKFFRPLTFDILAQPGQRQSLRGHDVGTLDDGIVCPSDDDSSCDPDVTRPDFGRDGGRQLPFDVREVDVAGVIELTDFRLVNAGSASNKVWAGQELEVQPKAILRDRHSRVVRTSFPGTSAAVLLSRLDFPGVEESDPLPTSVGGLVQVDFSVQREGVMRFVTITITRPADEISIWFELRSDQFDISRNSSDPISIFEEPAFFIPPVPRERMPLEVVLTIFFACFGCLSLCVFGLCKWALWKSKIRNPVEKRAAKVHPSTLSSGEENDTYNYHQDNTLQHLHLAEGERKIVDASPIEKAQRPQIVEPAAAIKKYQKKKGAMSHSEADAAFNRIQNELGQVDDDAKGFAEGKLVEEIRAANKTQLS